MLWNASVLSTASSDSDPTVVIAFDSAKYIFNVGENTTRAFLQSRQNWRKTRALFLTSVGTQRAGGLPGLLMTLADAGQSQINITGPSGLFHLIASMRKYTYRDNLIVTPAEVSLDPSHQQDRPAYKDENISVFALPIIPSKLAPAVNLEGEAISSLKRKREDSSGQSSKRPSSRPTADPRMVDISATAESLRKAASAPNFNPALLTGEVAQAWRRLVIQTMFPASQVASATPAQGGSGKCQVAHRENHNGNAKTGDGPSIVSRTSFPPKFSRPLPVPEHALVGSPDSALKPTVAYAVVGPRIRGKFDGRKAVELGLPPGPLRARLVRGESVTVQVKDNNGDLVDREIRPEDCIGESVTPAVVLLLDTPTVAHIPALLSSFAESDHFSQYLWKHANHSKQHKVGAIFHLCGDGVLDDERYKAFMGDLGPEVHHVVASRRYLANRISFTSAAYSQLRLNQLDPNIFPIQTYSCSPELALDDVPGLPARVTAMETNVRVGLHPPRPPAVDVDAGKGDLFHPAVCHSVPLALPESARASFGDARSHIARIKPAAICGGDVSICPLGTNSAMPSKYRNVSATLLHVPHRGYVLLDVGEGTWGQLARKFGDDPGTSGSVWDVLRALKCVFVSHMHGDHHIGLAKLLAMRRRLDPPCNGPLYLVGPDHLFVYLREYDTLEDLGLSAHPSEIVPISADALHWKNDFGSVHTQDASRGLPSVIAAHDDLCTSLGLASFRTVDVVHRTSCHGAILKHADGWSIVYSGDTVPTEKLVDAGQHATLLIHEATMADDQAEMATAKMHSTVGQAIDIGKRMHARHVLLTHFSARYPNVPPSVVTPREAGDPIVALALDHAHVRIGDMWKMNVYIDAIERSFADLGDDEDGAMGEVQIKEVDVP